MTGSDPLDDMVASLGFDRGRCECCGRMRTLCPECGSHKVSVDSRDAIDSTFGGVGSPDYDGLATRGDHDDATDYALVCWDCGWIEARRLRVKVLTVDHGDEWTGGGEDE